MDQLASQIKELPVEMISKILSNLESPTYYTIINGDMRFHDTFDIAIYYFTENMFENFNYDRFYEEYVYKIGTKKNNWYSENYERLPLTIEEILVVLNNIYSDVHHFDMQLVKAKLRNQNFI